jgi:hypothetical protein
MFDVVLAVGRYNRVRSAMSSVGRRPEKRKKKKEKGKEKGERERCGGGDQTCG